MYGKQTETAIAAMSRLAEVYDGGRTRLSTIDIAEERGLQGPSVAKVLTALSQAGLVTGMPGPGGGYVLGLSPGRIKLYDIYRLFERENRSTACPFGGGVCGKGDPCAVHDKLVAVQEIVDRFLRGTTLEEFRAAYQDEGRRPAAANRTDAQRTRKTYRAAKHGVAGSGE